MGTAKSNGIEGFRHKVMDYTQNKSFGKKLWHNNFSTTGRTNYWDVMFNHCMSAYSGVLKWKA